MSEIRRDAPSLRESDGPWLIRSHYHGAWHRRSSDGGACGYTDDIAHAGVFEFEKARHYNDWPGPSARDEAIPISRVVAEMEARAAILTAELAGLHTAIASVRTSESGRKDGSTHQNPALPDTGERR